MLRNQRTQAVVAVALLALITRVGFVAWNAETPVLYDAADYYHHAESIAAGDGYPEATPFTAPSGGGPTALRPPAYPFVLGGVLAVAGSNTTAARALGVVLGTAAVVLTMLIAVRVWGDAVALVAGVLAAAFPPLVALSAAVISEVLYIPLELGVVLALLAYRASPDRLRWAVLAGLLCGLAALTRTAGLFVLIPVLLSAWLPPRRAPRQLVGPAVLALAFAATLAPWTIRNAMAFDSFIPVSDQTGFALAGAYNSQFASGPDFPDQWLPPTFLPEFRDLYRDRSLNEAEFSARLGDRARAYAEDDPASVLLRVWVSSERLFAAGPGGRGAVAVTYREMSVRPVQMGALTDTAILLGVLAIGGVMLLLAPGAPISRKPGTAFMWWIPILSVAPALVATGSPRYRMPLDPFLCMLAAVALVCGYRVFTAWICRSRPTTAGRH